MRRYFTRRERVELYLGTEGSCALCGRDLDPSFHADHVQPFVRGGLTESPNGQPLCLQCSLKKGANMLRSHQTEFQKICREIKLSQQLRRVILHVCPGGGKSAIPVIAAHELVPAIGEFVGWITPRENLRYQGETAFTAGWLRSLIGHNNEARATANDADLLRGKIGYVTTYQALIAARSYRPNPHLALFRRKRGILILDEPNHLAVGEDFAAAVEPLIEEAAVVVLMGGHFTRHDDQRIAFLDYLPPDSQNRSFVDLTQSERQRTIRYSLSDATREHAIIKINFELRDAKAGWDVEDDNGVLLPDQIASFVGASRSRTKKALFTALNTELFDELIAEAVQFWRDRRRHNPRSRLFIVAPSISQAERAYQQLQKMNVHDAGIAHSEDAAALETIERFQHKRRPHLNVLSSVAMVYEGMDVPEADVLVCLTHIRSREWIEQVLHRVTRHDRTNQLPWEQQFATIFAPRDRFFVELMAEIKADQAPFVVETPLPGPTPPSGGQGGNKVHARESAMTNGSAYAFDGDFIEPPDYDHLTDAMKSAGIHGGISKTQAKKFFEEMSAPRPAPQAAPQQPEADLDPPRVREKRLRDQIKKLHHRGYDSKDPVAKDLPRRRGLAMWKIFQKGVEDMTEQELQYVVAHPELWCRT